MFKKFLLKKLAEATRQYFAAHPDIRLIIVIGSIGKTTTKIDIANVLSRQYMVRMYEGEPKSRIDTMLQLMGVEYPNGASKHSIFAWLTVLKAVKRRIKDPSDAQYIIQELDPWGPGAATWFAGILQPDIAVVSGINHGVLRGFSSIEDKAKEVLEVANFCKYVLLNRDDSEGRFASFLNNPNITTYGTDGNAEHRYIDKNSNLEVGYEGVLASPLLQSELAVAFRVFGENNLRPAIAAAVIGLLAGMSPAQVSEAVSYLRPLPGRMNILRGVRDSTIIDDSFGATYPSAMAALQMLYLHMAPQRIAVFGDMLATPEEHEALGAHCDGMELQWVVTVGELANRYIAPQAKAQSCQVRSFKNALAASVFIAGVLEKDALILFKGKSEGVYLEEAIKAILHSTASEKLLPRQTEKERAAKAAAFAVE